MTRAGPRGYFVSPRYQYDKVVASTVTLDEAFYQATRHATKDFGVIYFAWHWEDGSPRVRAFTVGGKAKWAKQCPKQATNGCDSYCNLCGGLGMIEQ